MLCEIACTVHLVILLRPAFIFANVHVYLHTCVHNPMHQCKVSCRVTAYYLYYIVYMLYAHYVHRQCGDVVHMQCLIVNSLLCTQ